MRRSPPLTCHSRATIDTTHKTPRFAPLVPGIATVRRRTANGPRVVVKPRSGAHPCVQAKPVIRADHDLLRRCHEGLSWAEAASEACSGGGRPRGCNGTVTAVVAEAASDGLWYLGGGDCHRQHQRRACLARRVGMLFEEPLRVLEQGRDPLE